MTFIPTLNAGTPQGLPMGYTNADLANLNLQTVQLTNTPANPNQVWLYGLPVKIVGQNSGKGLIIVDAISSNIDPVFGIILANSYIQESSLQPGSIVTILQQGLQARVKMLATSNINAGQPVQWDLVNNGVTPSSTANQILGVAQETGLVGDVIDVLLLVPNVNNLTA
jgi:hypothetical protein